MYFVLHILLHIFINVATTNCKTECEKLVPNTTHVQSHWAFCSAFSLVHVWDTFVYIHLNLAGKLIPTKEKKIYRRISKSESIEKLLLQNAIRMRWIPCYFTVTKNSLCKSCCCGTIFTCDLTVQFAYNFAIYYWYKKMTYFIFIFL